MADATLGTIVFLMIDTASRCAPWRAASDQTAVDANSLSGTDYPLEQDERHPHGVSRNPTENIPRWNLRCTNDVATECTSGFAVAAIAQFILPAVHPPRN